MRVIKGVVSKIFNKDIPTDKYDNVTRLSVQIGEEWIGFGGKKFPGLSVKQGGSWVDVKEGDTVECVVEDNGDFINGKTTGVKLVSKGSGAPPAQPKSAQAKAPQAQKTTGVDWDKRDTDIKPGMFFNNACQIAMNENKKVSVDSIVAAYRMVEKAYEECRNGTAAEQYRPQASDYDGETGPDPMDDDIPF